MPTLGRLPECLNNPDFTFTARSRRPPGKRGQRFAQFLGNQVVWNHLLSLIEIQGLDPYMACLHEGQSPASSSGV